MHVIYYFSTLLFIYSYFVFIIILPRVSKAVLNLFVFPEKSYLPMVTMMYYRFVLPVDLYPPPYKHVLLQMYNSQMNNTFLLSFTLIGWKSCTLIGWLNTPQMIGSNMCTNCPLADMLALPIWLVHLKLKLIELMF